MDRDTSRPYFRLSVGTEGERKLIAWSVGESTGEDERGGIHSIRRMLSQKTKEVVGVIQEHIRYLQAETNMPYAMASKVLRG